MCGIAGLISAQKKKENGERIKRGIVLQNERGNGLGAGYAAYGIYPEYRDLYAFHIMSDTVDHMHEVHNYLEDYFIIHQQENIKVWEGIINDHPLFCRFFLEIHRKDEINCDHDDFVIDRVMHINSTIPGSYVCSSGKNMGVFKGVGTPEDIYDFFCLDSYEGYCWIAHNRFPTNTPGWWGGAHPFNLLDWSIVHNGEISSYGINKRYLEMFDYQCNLQTDSEVIAYLVDLLIRKHNLPLEEAFSVLAPSYWARVNRLPEGEEKKLQILKKVIYESAMLNGPFAVVGSFHDGIFSITDNTKLRPLAIGKVEGYTYFSSEVSALYEMDDAIGGILTPRAGQPEIVYYESARQEVTTP